MTPIGLWVNIALESDIELKARTSMPLACFVITRNMSFHFPQPNTAALRNEMITCVFWQTGDT